MSLLNFKPFHWKKKLFQENDQILCMVSIKDKKSNPGLGVAHL